MTRSRFWRGTERLSKAGLGIALSLGLFSVQAVLPVSHGASVALEEAAAHSDGLVWNGRSGYRPVRTGHSHHDPASCPIDRFLSQGRWGLAPEPVFPISFSEAEFLSFGRPVFLPLAPTFPGASPRAPPRGA